MGGSSGGGVPGPTAAEQQQVQLQNQLLQRQIQEQLQADAERRRLSSAPVLNQQRQEQRGKDQRAYEASRTGAYQTARGNITNAFEELGQPELAQPYLQALQRDYDQLRYHTGTDYVDNTTRALAPVNDASFDEAAYLEANPDVAAGIRGGQFTSGRHHYDLFGRNENRQAYTSNTTQTPGTSDWWDDPTRLTTTDYIGNAINDIRGQRKQSAADTARTTAQARLQGMGLDDANRQNLSGWIDKRINDTFQNVGTTANDYTGVFDPDAILNSVLDQERNAARGMYTTRTQQAFSGLDPNQAFADTADDSYINDIVGRSYTDAFNALERGKARGALTDAGYNSGLSYLGDQKNTALSTAQTLGGAVLERNRGALSGIKSNALTAAGGYDFGQSFDPNKFLNEYQSKQQSLATGLGGEISNALAGQNWFNVGDVLTKAGYAQGSQNVNPLQSGFDTPALAALQNQRDKTKNAQRGLGGTGVF